MYKFYNTNFIREQRNIYTPYTKYLYWIVESYIFIQLIKLTGNGSRERKLPYSEVAEKENFHTSNKPYP